MYYLHQTTNRLILYFINLDTIKPSTLYQAGPKVSLSNINQQRHYRRNTDRSFVIYNRNNTKI